MNKISIIVFLILANINVFAKGGDNPKEVFGKAIKKIQSGDAPAAIKLFDEAIKLNPDYLEAYYNRGNAKLSINDFDGAIQDFDKTLELDKNFYPAQLNKAAAKGKKKEYDGAKDILDNLIDKRPNYAKAYTMRAQINNKNNNRNEACDDYAMALSLGDNAALKNYQMFCKGKTIEAKQEVIEVRFPSIFGIIPPKEPSKNPYEPVIYLKKDESKDAFTLKGVLENHPEWMGYTFSEWVNLYVEQIKKKRSNARYQEIEKDENTEFSWAIFEAEVLPAPSGEGSYQLIFMQRGYYSSYFVICHYDKAPDEENKKEMLDYFKTLSITYK